LPKILGVADSNIDNKTILTIGKGIINGKSNCKFL